MDEDVRSSLSLPTELLVKIVQYCEDYDWPDDPNAEYIAMTTHFSDEWDHLTWFRAAASSKGDICNIRQTCRRFRAASIPSFGWLLGHRIFRLTMVGLQDLQDIAKVDGLSPWIKTLTFGSADVNVNSDNFEVLVELLAYEDEMHPQLSSIQQAYKAYKRLTAEEIKQGLRASLKEFPTLKHLQLVMNDEASYLGGWLTPEQREYLNAEISLLDEWYFQGRSFYDSWPRGRDIACTVMVAVQDIGGQVEHLTMSTFNKPGMCYLPETLPYFLPNTISTLRMSIDWNHFKVEDGMDYKDYSAQFFRAIRKMLNLQNLALYLTDHDYNVQWTNKLFKGLHESSKLERIDLKGKWTLSPRSLLAFVQRHLPILRILVLEGCCLEGKLLPTLRSLAALTHGRIEYLRMWHMREAVGTLNRMFFEDVALDGFLGAQWPQFTCVTDFGPDFRLLPDPDEEGGKMLESGDHDTEGDGEGGETV